MSHFKAPYNDSKERIALDLMTQIADSDYVSASDHSPTPPIRNEAYWLDLYAKCLSTPDS